MKELKQADYDKLVAFAMHAMDHGSKYPGMTYEEGIMAVLDVIDGNQTADEVADVHQGLLG